MQRSLFALLLLLLLLALTIGAVIVGASGTAEGEEPKRKEEEEDDSNKDDDDDARMPLPPVLLSRHMKGRWAVEWRHGCTSLLTTGHADFLTDLDMSWNHRSTIDGTVITRSLAGEQNLSYIPILTQIERPKTEGLLGSYGYQLCSQSSLSLKTQNRDSNARLIGMPETETRVFRGFVTMKLTDSFFLDRCAGGQNKNFNLFVTTVGEPLVDPDEFPPGPMTHKFHEVRFQFRLPGMVGCGPETLGPNFADRFGPSNQFWDEKAKDALVDEGFEIITFKRIDRGSLGPKGFIESGNAVFAFAVLFMLVRVYTSYRYSKQKLELQQEIIKNVAEEVENNKKTAAASSSGNRRRK